MAEPDLGYVSMLADALTEECKHKKAVRVFFGYLQYYYYVPEEACRKYLEAAAAKAGMEILGRNEDGRPRKTPTIGFRSPQVSQVSYSPN